ncbi:MAG: DNA replication and repair protein RecF [Treponema sp.]|jgi:DNA replication and repair protein RecF|nr:DNA replication and repair protein RecF [Treponema sp.]
MIFKSLGTVSFRNLADTSVDTGGKDVFLVGKNGQGKTNFLEALYFSAYASSFRGVRDAELARTGEKDFSVVAALSSGEDGKILAKCQGGKKTVLVNGKRVEDRKDLLSVIPCIVFCHEDMEFVAGSPERRRWFFDQCLSLCDPLYLDDLRRFRRVLKARNTFLKDHAPAHAGITKDDSTLDVLDIQFVQYGMKLIAEREKAAAAFSGIFGPLYEEVSGIAGVTVHYQPSWKGGRAEKTIAWLGQRRENDRIAGTSLSGPHRDRYSFVRGGADFSEKASTGQRRLLALLLRIAQARRFSEMAGKNPVLLLDDVLLEMDGEKRRKFISVMPEYDQAFFTFLPEEPYSLYRKPNTMVYTVEDGSVMVESVLAGRS